MEKSTGYFILIVLIVLSPFLAKYLKKWRRGFVLQLLAAQLDNHPKILEDLGELSIKDTKTFYVNFKDGEAEISMVVTGEKGSNFYNIKGIRMGYRRWVITSIT